jgi:molybdate transport repressor ModE-like protein
MALRAEILYLCRVADNFRTELDWEDVRFFAALARHGSLSAAARALSVNHATVARRVGHLEQTLGRKLFERRPNGYVLTAAGQSAIEAAGQMQNGAGALESSGPASGLSGVVRLTATPSLAESFLIPRLAAWQPRHPGLDIELVADNASRSLMRHSADVALRLARPEDGELIARRLVTIGYGFYGAQDWSERIGAGGSLVFAGFDEANAHLPEAVWLACNFPGARLVFRSNSQMSQAAAARSGGAIALLPHFLGGGLLCQSSLLPRLHRVSCGC